MDHSTREPTEIAILLYPGVQMGSVLGMTDLLTVADRFACEKNKVPNGSMLRITHWRREGADSVPTRVFDSAVNARTEPTTIVLPPALDPIDRPTAQSYAAWLRQRHADGTTLASVCAGMFVLGETGLLVGRTVTTHWLFEDAVRTRFPDLSVDTRRLIIEDGDILSAGGVMAWIDLTLKLIGRFLGGPLMIQTARAFVVDPPGREQAYYSAFAPKLTHGDTAILKVQHWLQGDDAEATDLATLASQAGLEKRTFLRRFQKATGLTTTDYIQRLRVGRAQELLQFANLSQDQIAFKVGYGDVGAFRKVFARVVGLTPGEYRKRFRA